MGVDHATILPTNGRGRSSVRISSQKSWTHGLFIGDLAHMPGSICGTWPACETPRVTSRTTSWLIFCTKSGL